MHARTLFYARAHRNQKHYDNNLLKICFKHQFFQISFPNLKKNSIDLI